MMPKRKDDSTGRMFMAWGSLTVTIDGKTEHFEGTTINKQVKDGQWVDVPPPKPRRKKIASREVKKLGGK